VVDAPYVDAGDRVVVDAPTPASTAIDIAPFVDHSIPR
jgi:hypothetical protein